MIITDLHQLVHQTMAHDLNDPITYICEVDLPASEIEDELNREHKPHIFSVSWTVNSEAGKAGRLLVTRTK